MNTKNVTRFFKHAGVLVKKNSPHILTAIGIGGMLSATVMAVKATPKAMKLIEAEKAKREEDEKLKPVDVVKVAWKPYIPAAVTTVVSIGCLVGANTVHAKRTAALATAYKISETALKEYKDAAVEVVGEETAKEIKEKMVEKRLEKIEEKDIKKGSCSTNAMPENPILFHDVLFDRYFYSDEKTVELAVLRINKKMWNNQYASLNEFYDELGVDNIEIGEQLGWNISRDDELEVSCNQLDWARDGRPCVLLEYHKAPEHDYYKM